MKPNNYTDNDYELWNEPAIEISNEELEAEFDSFRNRISRRRRGRSIAVFLSAAVVTGVFFLLGLSLGWEGSSRQDDGVQWTEVCVGRGEQRQILLSDGSRITLASGSRLLYPDEFSRKTRDVYMNGEALFEVSADKKHPFNVYVNGTAVQVTGTKFDVKAFQDEDSQVITLMEGSVHVTPSGSSSAIDMTPGKALAINVRTGNVNLFDVPQSKYPAWFKGEYSAYNVPLCQIASDLERIYNVNVIFKRKNLENQIFYISIVEASCVDSVLKALEMTGDVRVRKDGNDVYLY